MSRKEEGMSNEGQGMSRKIITKKTKIPKLDEKVIKISKRDLNYLKNAYKELYSFNIGMHVIFGVIVGILEDSGISINEIAKQVEKEKGRKR